MVTAVAPTPVIAVPAAVMPPVTTMVAAVVPTVAVMAAVVVPTAMSAVTVTAIAAALGVADRLAVLDPVDAVPRARGTDRNRHGRDHRQYQ